MKMELKGTKLCVCMCVCTHNILWNEYMNEKSWEQKLKY